MKTVNSTNEVTDINEAIINAITEVVRKELRAYKLEEKIYKHCEVHMHDIQEFIDAKIKGCENGITAVENKIFEYISNPEIMNVVNMSKIDFENWTRLKVAEIAKRDKKLVGVVYKQLYKMFSETEESIIEHNLNTQYNGVSRLELLNLMRSSENTYDRMVSYNFIKNVLKMSA